MLNSFHIEAQGLSDAGIVKEVNEDNYFYKIAKVKNEMTGIFAVADGVGGLPDGKVASSMAATAVSNWWDITYKKMYDEIPEAICTSLIQAVKDLNREIVQFSEEKGIKMATTLSVLLLHKMHAYIVHVGDSRIYRLKSKILSKLEQITIDQSCTIEKEVNGKIIRKNVLTDCIGAKANFNYTALAKKLTGQEVFLLCSDGIYKTVEDIVIKKVIDNEKNDLKQLCTNLMNAAKFNKETDNITVIAVKVSRS